MIAPTAVCVVILVLCQFNTLAIGACMARPPKTDHIGDANPLSVGCDVLDAPSCTNYLFYNIISSLCLLGLSRAPAPTDG